MPDEADNAQDHIDREHESMMKHRATIRMNLGESLSDCIECDEPIPEARRKAVEGCKTCVECQSKAEGCR